MTKKHMKIKTMALIAAMILSCAACGKNADQAAATTDTSFQSVTSSGADMTDATEKISTEESTEAISTEDKEERSTKAATKESRESAEEATEESSTEDVSETTDPEKETLQDPSSKADESTDPETTDAVEQQTKPKVTATKLTVSYIGGTKYVGDRIAASEVTVKVIMSDGSVLSNPSGWSMDTGYQLKEGNNTLTVSYEGLTATLTVTAVQRQVVEQPKPTEPETKPAEKTVTDVYAMFRSVTKGGVSSQFESGYYNPNDFEIGIWYEYSDGSAERFNTGWTCDQTNVFFDYGVPVTLTIRYQDYVLTEEVTATYGFSRKEAEVAFAELNRLRREAGKDELIWDEGWYVYACERAKAWANDFGSGHDGNYLHTGECLTELPYDVNGLDAIMMWRNSKPHNDIMMGGTNGIHLYGAIAIYQKTPQGTPLSSLNIINNTYEQQRAALGY